MYECLWNHKIKKIPQITRYISRLLLTVMQEKVFSKTGLNHVWCGVWIDVNVLSPYLYFNQVWVVQSFISNTAESTWCRTIMTNISKCTPWHLNYLVTVCENALDL